jgi:hypothetical protein
MGLLALGGALLLTPWAVRANPFTYGIITQNASNNKAWITIQDVGKTRNLDYGYVNANAMRTWKSGNYLLGSYYYVRFEFKGEGDKTLCDTRIETSIRGNGTDTGAMVYGYYDPKTNHCYLQNASR